MDTLIVLTAIQLLPHKEVSPTQALSFPKIHPKRAMSTPLTPQAARQDQRVVDSVRVVVHTLGPAGNISDNHWSIYLLLADSQGSIRINMRAEPGDSNGSLSWTKQAYLLTQSAIRHWDFPATQATQVRHIADFIYQQGRHRYNMSGGGSGCRYWM